MKTSWAAMLEGAGRSQLETAFVPAFLARQRWFGGKTRRIRATPGGDHLRIVSARWIATTSFGPSLHGIEVYRFEPVALFAVHRLDFIKKQRTCEYTLHVEARAISHAQTSSAPRLSGNLNRVHSVGGIAMLTGRRFKLEIATLAANDLNGKLALTTIPAGGIVKVVADPGDGAGMVEVLWEGRTFLMFAIDLERRGTEVSEERAR
jgi:hypothetical protein